MSPSSHQPYNFEFYTDSPSKRRPNRKNGRLYILLLFIWLRVVDMLLLFLICPRLPQNVKGDVILFLVASGVWSSGLLGAIWFRQNWARFFLAGTVLLAIVISLSLIPCLKDTSNPQKYLLFIVGLTAVYLPIAVVILKSRDICRLTEERNETF